MGSPEFRPHERSRLACHCSQVNCAARGNSAGFIALQPASFGSERHSPVGGTIEPPDGSPLHRISVGRFVKQPYQRKSHRLGLVGH
jgi:hypothetical protein